MRYLKRSYSIVLALIILGLPSVFWVSMAHPAEAASASGSWIRKPDGFYWQNPDGSVLRSGGWQILDGKRYFLAYNSGRRKTGWVTWKTYSFYLDPVTGILHTGITRVNGSYYYFSEEKNIPGRMITGFMDVDGKRCFGQENGKLVSGWRNIKGKRYYFGSDRAALSGWVSIDGKRYFFDPKEYFMHTGWLVRGKNTYYLKKDGTPAVGYVTIGGYKYYFKASYGIMYKGWHSANGHKYYYDANGRMLTGLQSVEGRKCLFNSKWGYLETGWKTYEGGTYYLGADGTVRTGMQSISGKVYLFDNDGKLITGRNRAYKLSEAYYFVSPDGSVREITKRAEILACERLDQVGWDLQSAFNWSAYFTYVSIPEDVPEGYSPVEHFAQFGFEHGYGECYVKACTFYEMAGMLGYKVKFMQGYVPSSSGGLAKHGWVEIYYNDRWSICDPSFHRRYGRGYMIYYGMSGTWKYMDYKVAEQNF